MDLHFESFTASLVDVWAFDDSKGAALGRERHWTADIGAGPDGGVDNLLSALVDDAVVIGLEANSNLDLQFS